jgi:Fic family protein
LLCSAGVLREPLLYLSLFLKEHRNSYYDLLETVRRDGDWEAWLSFFFAGVEETATSAVANAHALSELFRADRERIEQQGRRSGSVLRVHEALKARPISSLTAIIGATGLSFPTVAAAVKLLARMNVVRELTGRRRNRLFVYDEFLRVLNEEA